MRALDVEENAGFASRAGKVALFGLAHDLAQIGGEQNVRARVDGVHRVSQFKAPDDDIVCVVPCDVPWRAPEAARFGDLDGECRRRLRA